MLEVYGISATASQLVGEYDLNFAMRAKDQHYLLKIARTDASREDIEFQNLLLENLATRFPSQELPVPRVIPTLFGHHIADSPSASGVRSVRLLSFLEGRVLAYFSPHTPELLESLGGIVAKVDYELSGLSHTFAGRDFKWNLTQSDGMLRKIGCITDPRHRDIANHHLEYFANDLKPGLAALPEQIIHGDANDHNVVVTGVGYDARVTGLIDFGDAMLAPTVGGLAIALAYAMLNKPDPIAAAASVVSGYHRIRSINGVELEMLYPLVLTRQAVSVTNSASEKRLRPNDRIGSHFWGFEQQGVVPDIVALGKPIGNGFPLGAVVTTPRIAASFDNGMEFFATFGGHPVSCAVGMAVLDVIEAEQSQLHALQLGSYLMDGLRSLQREHEVIGDIRGLGLFNGIEFVMDRETKTPAPQQAAYVANRLRDLRILTGIDGPFHNVIKLRGPMVLRKSDVDALLTALSLILCEDAAKT